MADSRGSLCSPKAGLGRIRLLPTRAAYELSCELTQPATTGRREACRKADSQRCYQWTPRLVMASMSQSGDVRSLGLVGADRRAFLGCRYRPRPIWAHCVAFANLARTSCCAASSSTLASVMSTITLTISPVNANGVSY